MMCLMAGCEMMPVEKEVLPVPTVKEFEKEEVKLVAVERGTLVQEEYIRGEFLAGQKEEYSYEKAGLLIEAIYVKVGDEIKKGDILAETDNQNIKKSIESQEQTIAKMEMNIRHTLEQQEFDVKVEQEKLENYQKQYDKALELQNSVGKENYIYSANEMKKYEENVTTQQKKIDKLLDEHERTNYDLNNDLAIEKVKLDNYYKQLEATRIYATIDGVVTYVKDVEVGNKTVADEKLITVLDRSTSLFRITGSNAEKFKIGDEVEIIYNEAVYKAVAVDPQGIVSEKNLKKDAIYMQAEGLPTDIEEGSSGKIYRLIDKAENVLYLPKSVVSTANEKSFVYVYVDEVKQKREVVTGFSTNTVIEIKSGLTEGELIVK